MVAQGEKTKSKKTQHQQKNRTSKYEFHGFMNTPPN